MEAMRDGYSSYVNNGFGNSVKNNLSTPATVFGFNSFVRSTFFPFYIFFNFFVDSFV